MGPCDVIVVGAGSAGAAAVGKLSEDPGCRILLLEAGCDWREHAAGSRRMTAYEDPRGVVNPDLSVKGIAGLRITDASIMPADRRADTHVTCVMVGLTAASHIAAAQKTAT
jgi:5-(hydroxymethyl)furfural/furfural oxidase